MLHDKVELDNHFLTKHPDTTLETYFLSNVATTTNNATVLRPVDAATNEAGGQDDDDDDIMFVCEVPAKETTDNPYIQVKQEGVKKRSAKRSRPTFQKFAATTTTNAERQKRAKLASADRKKTSEESDAKKIKNWSKFDLLKDEKKCRICSKSFAGRSRSLLEAHIREIHDINLIQYINLCLEGANSWSQGCLYRCFYCTDTMYITTSYQQLSKHIATKHIGKTQLKHTHDFGLRYVESTIGCPFCKISILHTYKTILRHTKRHKKSMDEFKAAIKKRLGSNVKSQKSANKSHKPANPKKRLPCGVRAENLAKYCCPPCQANFVTSGSLLKHTRKHHNFTGELQGDDELKAFSNQLNKYGECRVCKRMMINKMEYLRVHLQKHNTSVEDYLKKYNGGSNQEKGDKQVAGENREAENDVQGGSAETPAENVEDPIFISCDGTDDANDENAPSPIAAEEEEEESDKEGDDADGMDSELETSDEDEDDADLVGIDSIRPDNADEEAGRNNWHSRCTYQCYICNTYETSKLDILRHHLKAKHQVC